MSRDAKDFLQFLGVFIAVSVSIGFLFTGLLVSYQTAQCEQYAEMLGYESKSITGGRCMVKDPEEGWMSYDERVGRRVNQ